jgi:hypothetical protein
MLKLMYCCWGKLEMRISKREDFDNLLNQINNDQFRDDEIDIACHHRGYDYNVSDNDVQALEQAINNNQWCQDNLSYIDLSNNKLTIVPQFKCRNLQKLNLYGNALSDCPQLTDTPNLQELAVQRLCLTRAPSVNMLTELRFLRISSNKLRVPPNVVMCTNLRYFFMIENNPLTWLGKYALVVMKRHNPSLNLNDQHEFNGGLSERFVLKHALHWEHIPDYITDCVIPPTFFEQYGSIPNFIDQFVIPEELFEQQVAAVVELMQETYCYLPATNPNAKIYKDLVARKYYYMQSKYQLFELIDCLVQKKTNISKDVITGKISEFWFDLKEHQQFFLNELYYDFNTLKDIFIATNKPQHAEAIDAFIDANKNKWTGLFNIEQELFVEAQKYFELVAAKHLDTKATQEKTAELRTSKRCTM